MSKIRVSLQSAKRPSLNRRSRAEKIVEKLDDGNLPLDESIAVQGGHGARKSLPRQTAEAEVRRSRRR